jgi:hypothetical protein
MGCRSVGASFGSRYCGGWAMCRECKETLRQVQGHGGQLRVRLQVGSIGHPGWEK